MEINFIYTPVFINGCDAVKLEWYIYLEEDEKKFGEEMKQEIDLDLKEQYGGEKLW